MPDKLINFSPTEPVKFPSQKGVDYTKLRSLLEAQKWKQADKETASVMLMAGEQQHRGYLVLEELNQFPSTDLQTIDRLWLKYSNGRFGLSLQKRFWLELGGKLDYSVECRLGSRLGWRVKQEWLLYEELTFFLNAPPGHLPAFFWGWLCFGGSWGVCGSCLRGLSLLARLN